MTWLKDALKILAGIWEQVVATLLAKKDADIRRQRQTKDIHTDELLKNTSDPNTPSSP